MADLLHTLSKTDLISRSGKEGYTVYNGLITANNNEENRIYLSIVPNVLEHGFIRMVQMVIAAGASATRHVLVAADSVQYAIHTIKPDGTKGKEDTPPVEFTHLPHQSIITAAKGWVACDEHTFTIYNNQMLVFGLPPADDDGAPTGDYLFTLCGFDR